MYRRFLRRTLPVSLLSAALAATAAAAPAGAQRPDPAPTTTDSAVGAGPVGRVLDSVAQQLAGTLDRHPDLPDRVVEAPVDLLTVAPGSDFGRAVTSGNARVLATKGLPATAGSVLQLRLADPAMAPALAAGQTPLLVPTGSDDASTVVGYGPDRVPVALDPARLPERPVLLVELDMARVVPIGLAVLRERLAAHGLSPAPAAGQGVAAGYWATRIDAIRLSDVKEPWFKGAAEIFSIVGGFDLQGEATVRVVNMPYLDDEDRTYLPHQLLVHFNGYKYDLADVVMMEDDGDTNYQALAQALISALLVVTDLGMYQPLVDPILNAIPSSWWTDDPDYVESWHTLSTGSSGRLHGASGNGWMDVTPHFVQEL